MIVKYFAKYKLKNQLRRAFRLGGIFLITKTEKNTYKSYPKIHEVHLDNEKEAVRFTFTIPSGVNPDLIEKQDWVFKQIFGKNVEIKGKLKKFTLWCYANDMPSNIPYDYDEIESRLRKKKIPILCGVDRSNHTHILDMAEEHHMLLTGTTGSGKSSLIRGILTSLMLNKTPEEMVFLLGDLKFSEFGIYKNLESVLGVCMDEETLLPALVLIQREMERRGQLLDVMDVESIYELKEKLPVILIAIDEVILLRDNPKIMKILERISCIGRSNGIYLLLAMQRGDAKSLGGQLKNNLTFRMSGKQSDEYNAKISGLSNSTGLDVAGRMMLQTSQGEKLLQVPFMDKKTAKVLLSPLKRSGSGAKEVFDAEEVMDDRADLPNWEG